MKIKSGRRTLGDALTWVAKALPKRPTMPEMAGIRLTATEGALTLTAFDWEVSHQATLDGVHVGEPGEVLVSGRFLADVVNGLKGGVVEMAIDDDLVITSGRSKYRTRPMRLAEWPTLPEFPKRVGLLPADDLRALVDAVKDPIDPSGVREEFMGLHLESDKGSLWAVGMRPEQIHAAPLPWDGDDLNITVPAPGLISALSGMAGDVKVCAAPGMLGLRDAGRAVTMRAFDAQYAKGRWRAVIRAAKDDAMRFTLDPADLHDAVKNLGDLTLERLVLCEVTKDRIEVSLGRSEIGEGTEVLDAEANGSCSFHIYAPWFCHALDAVPSGPVVIGTRETGSLSGPLVVRPTNHAGMTFVVMPRRPKG